MPSTFFGLTIASSGLSAYQVALNTSANNISNVQTKGYSKQQANRVASESIRAYAKYGSMGTGVTTESVKQLRNQYYDNKYWYNQSSVGLYETKLNYLKQIENYFIDDDSSKGFSTILNTMFNDLDTLKNNAGDVNTRQQLSEVPRTLQHSLTALHPVWEIFRIMPTRRSSPRFRISIPSQKRLQV